MKVDNEYLHIELNCNYKNYLHTRNFIYFTNIYSRKTVRGKKYDFKIKFIHIDKVITRNKIVCKKHHILY